MFRERPVSSDRFPSFRRPRRPTSRGRSLPAFRRSRTPASGTDPTRSALPGPGVRPRACRFYRSSRRCRPARNGCREENRQHPLVVHRRTERRPTVERHDARVRPRGAFESPHGDLLEGFGQLDSRQQILRHSPHCARLSPTSRPTRLHCLTPRRSTPRPAPGTLPETVRAAGRSRRRHVDPPVARRSAACSP